ncbi:MAG: type IV pilus secretin PilQ [Myxococcota bacterium]|nr:type IV pilus secretin PilQ [Myxococcota bacterium]
MSAHFSTKWPAIFCPVRRISHLWLPLTTLLFCTSLVYATPADRSAQSAAHVGEESALQFAPTALHFDADSTSAQLRLELPEEAEVLLFEQDPRAPVLILKGLSLTAEDEQRFDVSAYESFVSAVELFRGADGTPQLLFTLSEAAEGELLRDGHHFLFRLRRLVETPAPLASRSSAPSASGAEDAAATFPQIGSTDEVSYGVAQPIGEALPPGYRPLAPRRRQKRYNGQRISINIQNSPIQNVLRFIAQWGKINIVTSDEVDGDVTLMLNQVPWDQALEIVLRSKGLDMVRQGNIIRVAPREALAAERKAELAQQQLKEQLKPILIRLITVNHADGPDMVNQVKEVLSERGSVTFDERTNTLILKDTDEHIGAAEDLIRRLDTQTPQVLIEARIVEVNKVNEEQFGIQWGGQSLQAPGQGNATGLFFPSSVRLFGSADDPQIQPPGYNGQTNFMINLPATVGSGSGGALGLSLGSVDNAFNLNIRLSAAANRGQVKIISSPRITTLDNKTAMISQGVSIPISQVSAQGVQTTFFDATLKLQVTPHVTQDGSIYLRLKANNDTPDFQNVGSRGDPTILKKQASTQVLLRDGETTVIGGIYTSNAGFGQTEYPYLAQIPILGALFRNTNERSQRNELLIFVTPRVVNRAAAQVRTR